MATYYVDYVNGYDRPPSQAAIATQVAGTTGIMITCGVTDHGLITGDEVVLSGFTAYLNAIWTITVVDSRKFTLDGAVWATTGDPNGVCQLVVTTGGNDGSSWANAFKQIGSASIVTGIQTVSLQPGDIIKVAKTPDPVSIGDATWENRTKTVQLAASLTQIIDSCIGNTWTAVSPTTLGTNTTRKKASNCQQINIAATTGIGKIAYKTLGSTLDLSSFQNISLFFGGSDVIKFMSSKFRLCLCSDTVGNTIVDSFYLDDILSTYGLSVQTYKKGSALGSTINSVAIYREGSAVSFNIRLQAIIACNSLALDSLIGKSNALNTSWFPIKYIDGTTVELDSATLVDYTGYYYGDSETVETFVRETFKTPVLTANQKVISFPASGLDGNTIKVTGGWNPDTDEQDGETWLDNINHTTTGIYRIKNIFYIEINKLNFVRFNFGFETYIESYIATLPTNWLLNDISFVCNIYGASFGNGSIVNNLQCLHNRECGLQLYEYNKVANFIITGNGGIGAHGKAGIQVLQHNNHISDGILMWNARSLVIDGVNNILRDFIFSNTQNQYPVVEYGSNNKFINIDSYLENTGAIGTATHLSGINELVNCKMGQQGGYPLGTPANGQGIVKFTNHWGESGRTGMIWGAGSALLLFKPELSFGSTFGIWSLFLNRSSEISLLTLNVYCPIAPIAVKAGISTTVGLWIKKSNNSIGSELICRRDMSLAIDEDITSSLPLADNVWVLAGINIVADRDGVVLLELHGNEPAVTTIYFSTLVT